MLCGAGEDDTIVLVIYLGPRSNLLRMDYSERQ